MTRETYPKKGFREIAFKGRLKTADPPTNLAPEDFQVLKNLRYNRGSLKSIAGQTKINTTATAVTALKSAVHFRKDFPAAESHFIVGTTTAIYDNTTPIPNQGDFSSLFTPTGSGNPRLSLGPNGSVAMANGTDTVLWYGTEGPISGYLDWDSVGGTYKYDYLEQVSNSKTSDYALVHRYSDAIDTDTVLLLHCDGTDTSQVFTDSSPNAFTVNVTGHTNTRTAIKKFGTASASFDGDGDNLYVADHANFNFSSTGSDGDFTIDFFMHYGAGETTPPQGTIYYQATDANNYVRIYTSGIFLYFELYKASVKEVEMVVAANRASYPSPPASFIHVAVVGQKSGTNYLFKLYFDGSEVDYHNNSTANDFTDFTGVVYIGSQGGASYLSGYLDEIRVSKVSRWTSSFSPPSKAYGTGNITSLFIASPLPAKGIKFYVSTVNTTAGTSSVSYWDGAGWTDVSGLSDGTASAGKPLAQTGTMSFTSTASTARLKNIEDVIAYWYKVDITEVDTTTRIYHVTVDCQMQQLKDLWDGVYRPTDAFLLYDDSAKSYNNWTANVFGDAYDSLNEGTFAKLGGFVFANDKLYVGSIDQLQGFKVSLAGSFENTAECTLTVEYWNGAGWTVVNATDGTRTGNISFAKSGTIHWTPPGRTAEFKTAIAGAAAKVSVLTPTQQPGQRWVPGQTISVEGQFTVGGPNLLPSGAITTATPVDMYFYRLSFAGNGTTTTLTPAETTTTGVHVYSVKTIPAPVDCRGYAFPLLHDDSLWLCGNNDAEPNVVIYSAKDRPQVFNGFESGKIFLGDNTGIVSGASFSNQYGATTQKIALIAKETSVWKIIGEAPYEVHPLSQTDGCIAPESMDVGEVEISEGVRRKVAVWVAQRGVVISDGHRIDEISTDIRDKFDPQHPSYLGASVLPTLYGRIDPVFNEYHLVVPGSAEWVFDFTENKWYQADRGSGAYLNGCVPVYDTSGVASMYGFTPAGFVMRLDNGTTFATADSTNDITSTVRLADIALYNSSIMYKSRINWSTLLLKTKANTTATVSETRYVDGETSGTTISTVDPTASGYVYVQGDIHGESDTGTFHSPEFAITTSDETIGFEPVLWGCNYTVYEREK